MREGPSGHQAEDWEREPEVTPPYGPTEVTKPRGATEVTRPYGPTEVTKPYAPRQAPPPPGPRHAASPYDRTQAVPPPDPRHAASPYDRTQPVPPHDRTQATSPYDRTQPASAYGPPPPTSPYVPANVTRNDPAIPGFRPAGRTGPATGDRASGSGGPQDLVRYGPGIPPSEGNPGSNPGLTAERVWRTGRPDRPHRRPPRLRRLLGSALTVALLAASGVLLYLRFHHAPFHVTAATITQQTPNSCGVNVTGRIDTNGAAGTVSYQWVFRPDPHPPQPLSESVTAGQHSVYVTVAVEGSGHGSAKQNVTLQVLGPDRTAASTTVTVSCR